VLPKNERARARRYHFIHLTVTWRQLQHYDLLLEEYSYPISAIAACPFPLVDTKMKITVKFAIVLAAVLILKVTVGTTGLQQPSSTRREAFAGISTLVGGGAVWNTLGPHDAALAAEALALENRDRKNNKDALIREDYWFQTGKLPPRLLTTSLQGDDPQWNAFGRYKVCI